MFTLGMRRTSASLLVFVAAACTPPHAAPSPSVSAPAAPPPSSPTASAKPSIEGASWAPHVLHLADLPDARNLELSLDDGRFRIGVDGCDFAFHDAGALRVDGASIVLEGHFEWPDGASVRNPVDRVVLSPGPSAGTVTATLTVRGARVEQTWTRGGLCASCGGVGPKGFHPCDAPYLGDAR